MAIDISRDLLGLNSALAQTRAELKNNKSELVAVNRAMRDNADNADLQRMKQELLEQQLRLTKEQINTLSSAQIKLGDGHDKASASATNYDSALKQLQVTALGIEGQIKKNTEVTDKDTEANERNTKSLRDRINGVRSLMSGAVMLGGMIQNVSQYTKDWNAVNEDGTPKMDAMAKSMAVLNTTMMAATVISAFAKAIQQLGIWGTVIGGALVAGMVTTILSLTGGFGGGSSSSKTQVPAYGGGGGYVGYGNIVGGGGVSSYSEKTINYNMNINANKYGAEFANNPAVIKPIVSALNQELGTKIK